MGLWTPEREKIDQAKDSAAGRQRSGDSARKVLVFTAVSTIVAAVTFLLRPADLIYEISLDATMEVVESELIVSGTTNLVDGSILRYCLTTSDNRKIEGKTTVADEAFSITISPNFSDGAEPVLGSTASREAVLVLLFEIVMPDCIQDVEIVRRYGGFGEHIGGHHVVRDERGNHVRRELSP